ncbi:MAG: hypothetical protein KIT22_18530, partial [Verrucomicrobiae bacterium]|nr:hypothetical protein [Verrucomicrobiae bacterium]
MTASGFRCAPRRWWIAAAAGVLFSGMAATPSLPLPVPVTARSVSGQFVVHGRGITLPAPPSEVRRVGTNDLITLRPDLLAVTAERTKRGLEQILEVGDRWQGAIHLQIGDPPATEPLAVQTRW